MGDRKAILVDSLYRHALAMQAEDGSVLFLNPERVPYEDRDDTIEHTASGKDYLWDIALSHYDMVSIGDIDLGEVIANFQPEPLQDLSVPVAEGRELYIPSMDFITEVVRGSSLADEPEL